MVCNCTLAGTKARDTCHNNPSKVSKGYYEFKPFDKLQQISKEVNSHMAELTEMNNEAIRNRIRYIIYSKTTCTEEKLQEAVDEIMKVIKK